MFLLRNRGLQLPIYDEDTPVAWTTDDICNAANSGKSHFVRRTVLEYHSRHNLRRALLLGSTVIRNLGEELGVDVVPFTWGLYKGPSGAAQHNSHDKFYDSSAHPLIPEGYCLVAEVEAVASAEPLGSDEYMRYEGLINTRQYMQRGWRIRDLTPHQIVTSRASEAPRDVLVDIEPRLQHEP